jgi:polysaccharide export outer membrane protein
MSKLMSQNSFGSRLIFARAFFSFIAFLALCGFLSFFPLTLKAADTHVPRSAAGLAYPSYEGRPTTMVSPRPSPEITGNDNSKRSSGYTPGTSSSTLNSASSLSALLSLPSSMELLDDKTPLQSGESFSYAVLEDADEPLALYVDNEGNVNIPLIGKKTVTGKTPRALADEVKKQLEKEYYYKATVIVDRTLAAKGKVFISGQVVTSGTMEIPPSQVWTLSKTILTAGGFTDAADRSRVALIRKDPMKPGSENRQEFDVGKMLETGDFSTDPLVRPGDLVLVSRLDATARVTVSGQVMTPGVYNIPRRDFTVSQAIMSAGGLAKYGNARRVKLIRPDPKNKDKNITITVDLKKVLEQGRRDLDTVVEPNDTINVPERFISF